MHQGTLTEVIFYSFLGGAVSLLASILIVKGGMRTSKGFTKLAIPFAAGALLSAVFIDLLPEGLASSESNIVMTSALVGFLLFFTMERLSQWFHHHHEEDDEHHRSGSVNLFILANTLHNALDGVAIGSAFLVSTKAGIITTVVIAAHEIPHEIGDIGVLLARKLSELKVILANALGALAAVVLAVLSYVLGGEDKLPVGALLGLSAGFLIYVAASDLIPTIHKSKAKKGKIDLSLIVLIVGVLAVVLAVKLADKVIG